MKKFEFVNKTIAAALDIYVEKLKELKKTAKTKKGLYGTKRYIIKIGYGNKKYVEIDWKKYYYGYLWTT